MTLELRGSSLWWIRRYLTLLGGVEVGTGLMAGPGWTAALRESRYTVFRLEFPRVTVTFAGDPATVDRVAHRLRQMAHRGGG